MMAAVHAALSGAEVTLLEKNEKTGKKLYITGKGRCNLTNRCDIADFFGNVVTNSKFLYSALYSFTNEDTWEFFEDHGLKLKEERGMRVFPASDKSSDVIRTLDRALKDSGADVRLFTEVEKIEKLTDGNGMRFRIGLKDRQGKNSYIKCRSVIIATGGLSYKSTGSTGDGYVFARQLGHRVTETYPSLCPLAAAQEWVQELEGLSLKNVRVRITAAQNILQNARHEIKTARQFLALLNRQTNAQIAEHDTENNRDIISNDGNAREGVPQ